MSCSCFIQIHTKCRKIICSLKQQRDTTKKFQISILIESIIVLRSNVIYLCLFFLFFSPFFLFLLYIHFFSAFASYYTMVRLRKQSNINVINQVNGYRFLFLFYSLFLFYFFSFLFSFTVFIYLSFISNENFPSN